MDVPLSRTVTDDASSFILSPQGRCSRSCHWARLLPSPAVWGVDIVSPPPCLSSLRLSRPSLVTAVHRVLAGRGELLVAALGIQVGHSVVPGGHRGEAGHAGYSEATELEVRR